MTPEDCDRHIAAIRARENGWSDDQDDSGGPTHDGVTLEMWVAFKRAVGDYDDSTTWHRCKLDLKLATGEALDSFYRWYFDTQGLGKLIDEFDIPDELVPLVMDMRTLHSPEGCRKILRGALSRMDELLFSREMLAYTDAVEVITLSRMRYMLEVAERSPKDRKYVRGWMHRALKAIGMWPPATETTEV